MVALMAATAVVFRRPLFQGNFGVVDPGRVYRSAQPRGEGLRRILAEHRVASVLNLRGGSEADRWYAEELRATREFRADFYDFLLSAHRRPTRRELLTLLDLLTYCRYPLLIHCKSGADRTGMVVALYQMTQRGVPPARALRAFSIAYGHVPIGGPEHLHEPFLEYDAWLQARRLPHTPERFLDWVRHEYRAQDPLTPIPRLRSGPRYLVSEERSSRERREHGE
ncbi:MAG: tyrosine-protein phosphatase [Isosphaeraceae bacterium]|nr:tyrosine-protein phosphatase [Isosphaeraceae bacterium]